MALRIEILTCELLNVSQMICINVSVNYKLLHLTLHVNITEKCLIIIIGMVLMTDEIIFRLGRDGL